MIQRLVVTLRALAALQPDELRMEEGRRALADCADAVRLELDCPQETLSSWQQTLLTRLSDVLEGPMTDEGAALAAARDAARAVGLM